MTCWHLWSVYCNLFLVGKMDEENTENVNCHFSFLLHHFFYSILSCFLSCNLCFISLSFTVQCPPDKPAAHFRHFFLSGCISPLTPHPPDLCSQLTCGRLTERLKADRLSDVVGVSAGEKGELVIFFHLQKLRMGLFIHPVCACGPAGCTEMNRCSVWWSRAIGLLEILLLIC